MEFIGVEVGRGTEPQLEVEEVGTRGRKMGNPRGGGKGEDQTRTEQEDEYRAAQSIHSTRIEQASKQAQPPPI